MREAPADLEHLHALLDASIERASPFLRSSFEMPEHSLSAEQLARHLVGRLTVALATVTAGGEPRAAPIAAHFVRGEFWVPTVAEAARARHLAQRPAVSLTYFEGIDLAVIAHGRAEIVTASRPEFEELESIQVEAGNQRVSEWAGTGIYLRVRAETMYTYAREPARY